MICYPYIREETRAVNSTCQQCRTGYTGWVTWHYINDVGPFCERCAKKGIRLAIRQAEREAEG